MPTKRPENGFQLIVVFKPREGLSLELGTSAFNRLVGTPAPDAGYDFISKERDMEWYFKTQPEAEAAAERCRAIRDVKVSVEAYRS